MKFTSLLSALFLCSTFALSSSTSVSASTAIAFSVDDLIDRSESVVVAIARSRVSKWEGGRIVTYTTLDVDESMGGSLRSGESFTVRTYGGVVDGIGQITHGEAVLPLEQPMLLFTREHIITGASKEAKAATKTVLRSVTGMAQGVMQIRVATDKVARISAIAFGLSLIEKKVEDKVTKPFEAAHTTMSGRLLADVKIDLNARWAARAKK
jgi:hypothetical protein